MSGLRIIKADESNMQTMLRVPAVLMDELLRLVGESIILSGQLQEQLHQLSEQAHLEQEQNKLFQDLGRTSVQPTDGETSTGLGLAICKKYMDAHNGIITVNSEPGKGSEFIVYF